MRHRCLATLLSVLAAPLAAQTIVVDVGGGAGSQYSSIAVAAAAAPDGAVLRVRPGDYHESVVVTGKGLTITGDPTATIVSPPAAPALHVSGLGPAQTFVMRGIQARAAVATDTAELRLENNGGLVFVDQVDTFAYRRLLATNCDALLLSRCAFYGNAIASAQFDDCTAACDECSFVDLHTTASDLQLAGGSAAGSNNLFGQAGAAVTMQGGSLRVLGTSISGGYSPIAPGLAINGAGTVRLTPDATVSGAPGLYGPGIAVLTLAMPRTATSWITGNVYSAYMTGAAGDLGVLVMSVRELPQTLPGLDPIWLHAPTARVVTAGVFGSGTQAALTVLPTSPTFAGLSVVWQAFAFAPNGTLSVGNPTWRVLP